MFLQPGRESTSSRTLCVVVPVLQGTEGRVRTFCFAGVVSLAHKDARIP